MMKATTVILMVLSGLCLLPSCFPRLYIVVEKASDWAGAQAYCRQKYTDLASVHNEQELAELNKLLDGYYNMWIGLHTDTEAWRWSLENQSYYGEGEAGFRMWADGQPSAIQRNKVCVSMRASVDGKWQDDDCSASNTFLCYNNSTIGTSNTSSSLVFVNKSLTWDQARSYCKTHYTDLASVRNQAEHDQMRHMTKNLTTWIGLYRDSWKWSDGSAHSFKNWASTAPSHTHACVTSLSGKWVNVDCNQWWYFVCHIAPVMKKRLVRVELKKTGTSVDIEDLKEEILQEFKEKLKDHGLNEDINLRWVEQPDGKVFHKKHTYKKEKESFTLN